MHVKKHQKKTLFAFILATSAFLTDYFGTTYDFYFCERTKHQRAEGDQEDQQNNMQKKISPHQPFVKKKDVKIIQTAKVDGTRAEVRA